MPTARRWDRAAHPGVRAGSGVRRCSAQGVDRRLTARRRPIKIYFVRSAFLTKRGHIDLLRVASAACRPSL
ncbi:putative leader peptide [Plantactinospora sp. KLBMP9567]|uniref:putative leader peptide n=1 Tax=Plantactinospora sp. KLBMP9567 TaxID=3085900 RepID=UPI0039909A32